MTSTEVEELITIPMEDQLRGIPGVEYVRSSSVVGLSQVVLLFKLGTDLMEARQRVQERLKLAIAELPQSSGMPVMLQPLSSTSRVMKIGISSRVYDMMDLSMIAYWTIKFRLLSVPGVANVPIWGERIKSLQVQVAMKAKRADPPRLRDVATVTWGTWPIVGDSVINDGVGLMMIVEKLPWANTLDVTRGVEEALAKLRPGLPGIEIDSTIFRPATFIELSMHNLTMALVLGSVLVILVLGAFLFEWRVALISVIAIPLSLVAAGVVLYLLGATINTMVLAGFVVALGSVVDDAIIDVENIVRRLRQ